MKKWVSVLLAALLIVMNVFAVANAENNEIRVWLPPNGTDPEGSLDKEFWEKQFDAFEAETGAVIDVQIIPWANYPEKYMAGIVAGNGPDVGYMYADMFPDFIEMGAVMDLSEFITDEQREIYPYLDEGYILGAQYAIPFILGNPRIWYYNKALLTEAGVELPTEPLTWDEFVEICKKCTKDTDGDGIIDQWGTMMGWGETYYGILQSNFTPFLLQAGGELYAEDGRTATFGSEAGIRAAQFVHDLIYVHGVMSTDCTSMTSDDCLTMFNDGKVAFFPGTTGGANVITVDWGYIPCLEDKVAATMMVADQLVMLSGCRNPELSYELLTYMLSAPVQEAFHKELVPYPPISTEEPYNDNPAFEELYTTNKDMLKTEKPVRSAFKINDYLFKNLQLVMMDEMSAEEALTEAQDYANTVIQEY